MNLDTTEGMDAAKAWTSNFIALLNEGAVWAIPRSEALYQIYTQSKLALRLTDSFDGPTERVFKELGYDVYQKVHHAA